MTIINAEVTTYDNFLEYIEECIRHGFYVEKIKGGQGAVMEKEAKITLRKFGDLCWSNALLVDKGEKTLGEAAREMADAERNVVKLILLGRGLYP